MRWAPFYSFIQAIHDMHWWCANHRSEHQRHGTQQDKQTPHRGCNYRLRQFNWKKWAIKPLSFIWANGHPIDHVSQPPLQLPMQMRVNSDQQDKSGSSIDGSGYMHLKGMGHTLNFLLIPSSWPEGWHDGRITRQKGPRSLTLFWHYIKLLGYRLLHENEIHQIF